MKKVLNASIARIILSLLLLIILSAMVGLVIFAYSFLSKTSEEVGKMQTEATIGRASCRERVCALV